MVGLELDYGELRAVEMRRTKNSLQMINWARAPLPPETLDEGLILQPQAVGEILERFWLDKGFKSRDVVVGLSNKDVIIRFAEFPRVPQEKLRTMIRYQARDLLPISLDDAVMDFSVIGPAPALGEQGHMQEILLVATKRAIINNYLEALTTARLEPLDINVISLALQQLISPERGEGVVTRLNLANDSSNMLVTAAGIPRLARRLVSRLQDMAVRLDCPLQDVVARCGAAPGETFPDAFIDWGEALMGEIRSSINYYQSQQGAVPVEKLILSGRGAFIAGFARQMEEAFAIPVVPANPLQFLEKVPPAFTGTNGVVYAVSFALARGGLESA